LGHSAQNDDQQVGHVSPSQPMNRNQDSCGESAVADYDESADAGSAMTATTFPDCAATYAFEP